MFCSAGHGSFFQFGLTRSKAGEVGKSTETVNSTVFWPFVKWLVGMMMITSRDNHDNYLTMEILIRHDSTKYSLRAAVWHYICSATFEGFVMSSVTVVSTVALVDVVWSFGCIGTSVIFSTANTAEHCQCNGWSDHVCVRHFVWLHSSLRMLWRSDIFCCCPCGPPIYSMLPPLVVLARF